MRIILNADDFGLCDDTVAATIECFERGALTSASIMVNMPASEAAIDFARRNPRFSFGVHLTFVRDTVEAPISDPATLPALTDADGRFLHSNAVRWKALLNRLPADQIEREATAQIQRLRDLGVEVSHLDSHGHLHKFRPFREALQRVASQSRITRVRGVQDIYLRRPLKSPTYWLGGPWRHKLRRAFETTDHFYMPTSAIDQSWPDVLLSRVAGDSLEVGVHPGRREGWRDAERLAVARFAHVAREGGHTLIGWKDF